MISPAKQNVIQIEITNACVRECSNCTRFCGHHQKPFFMNLEMFKQAVESLEGYEGVVGVMGGEPTIHPQFKEISECFISYRNEKKVSQFALRPMKSFIHHVIDNVFNGSIHNGRGLWTSLTKKYSENFELIQEVYGYQAINDHVNDSLHQALLVSRADLNIMDEEWFKLRDNCWIQRFWSSSITPKGAFFCEVAAALDMLFDGPGGWPVEKDWWKRMPHEFGEQLQWCELCSAPLSVPKRWANDGRDDISPILYEKLKKIGSPKIKKRKFFLIDDKTYKEEKYEIINEHIPYLKDQAKRINSEDILLIKELQVVIFANNLEQCINMVDSLNDFLGNVLLIYENKEIDEYFLSNKKQYPKIIFKKTKNFKNIMFQKDLLNNFVKNDDWVLILEDSLELTNQFFETIKSLIFNPGCLYIYDFNNFKEGIWHKKLNVRAEYSLLQGKCYLFNLRARALKSKLTDKKNIEDWQSLWENWKIIILNDKDLTGNFSGNYYFGQDHKIILREWETMANKRTVLIFGAGSSGVAVWEMAEKNNFKITAFLDNDIGKHNKYEKISGNIILSPQILNKNEHFIVIASSWYKELKTQLENLEFVFNKDFVCFINT